MNNYNLNDLWDFCMYFDGHDSSVLYEDNTFKVAWINRTKDFVITAKKLSNNVIINYTLSDLNKLNHYRLVYSKMTDNEFDRLCDVIAFLNRMVK